MSGINEKSLWNDKDIESTFERLSEDQKHRYSKMADCLYNKVCDPTPYTLKIESAAQINLMLRDGLHPDKLNINEKEIYIETYGLKSLNEYRKDDDDRNDNLHTNSAKKSPSRTQKADE